jgi:hypothetical protein
VVAETGSAKGAAEAAELRGKLAAAQVRFLPLPASLPATSGIVNFKGSIGFINSQTCFGIETGNR